MSEELKALRAEIEALKRQLLEAALRELEEHIRLREARDTAKPTRLKITTFDQGDCGLLAPIPSTRRRQ